MIYPSISNEGQINSCEFAVMTAARVLIFAVYLFKIIIAEEFNNNCKTPNEEDGSCISVQQCRAFLQNVSASEFPQNISEDVLKHYVCEGTSGENPKVCCPKKIMSTLQINSTSHNVEMCGYESGSRIRTLEASIDDYKWQALLKYEKDGDPYICGGALISRNYIITAAHCIRNKYKLISARLGEYDIRTEIDCIRYHVRRNKDSIVKCKLPPQDFNISSEDTIVHPDYSPESLTNDIGLIKLQKEVDISENTVLPICLPSTLEKKSSESVVHTVAGWGASNSGLSSPILLQGYARKADETLCGTQNENLTFSNICASTRYTGGHCVTDDGGSLISYLGKESKFFLSGVATKMPSNCDADEIFVRYTKIQPYIKWILDHINA